MVITIIIDLIAETFFQGIIIIIISIKTVEESIKMNMLH